jgi:hypothetical protein
VRQGSTSTEGEHGAATDARQSAMMHALACAFLRDQLNKASP